MYDFAKLILSDSLSGFLKGHSCATALLKMTDDFRASLDNKDHCIAMAVDLSKAFDSISHSLLISKIFQVESLWLWYQHKSMRRYEKLLKRYR